VNFISYLFAALSAVAVVFAGAVSYADAVYVKEVGGEGVDGATKSSVRALIRSAVGDVKGFSVSDKSDGAKIQLSGELLKLGDAYILTLEKLISGKSVYSSKMKSTTLEDMDKVTERLVDSVLNEKSVAETATTSSITRDEETKGNRRYQATRQWRFSFGPAWSDNLNADGPGTVFGIGYIWGLDPYVDLKLVWSGYSPRDDNADDADYLALNFGINKFFDLAKHSPYVTGSVAYVSASASDGPNTTSSWGNSSADNAKGWGVSAGGGYKFFRTSNVNVGLELNYNFLFDKTDITKNYPSTTYLEIVVYY